MLCVFGRADGGIAQWLERSVHTRNVDGSNPSVATIKFTMRPGGQAVKTPPFHGGNTSSILVRVTKAVAIATAFNFKTNNSVY